MNGEYQLNSAEAEAKTETELRRYFMKMKINENNR